MGDARLEDLHPRLVVTTTDLVAGKTVVHRTGDAVEAVVASMAVPGLIRPQVCADGRILVDGGVLDNFPGRVARDLGADLVIGVDLSARGRRAREATAPGKLGSWRALARAWRVRQGSFSTREAVDLVIQPQCRGSFFDLRNLERFASAGESATRERLPEIRRLVASVRNVATPRTVKPGYESRRAAGARAACFLRKGENRAYTDRSSTKHYAPGSRERLGRRAAAVTA